MAAELQTGLRADGQVKYCDVAEFRRQYVRIVKLLIEKNTQCATLEPLVL